MSGSSIISISKECADETEIGTWVQQPKLQQQQQNYICMKHNVEQMTVQKRSVPECL